MNWLSTRVSRTHSALRPGDHAGLDARGTVRGPGPHGDAAAWRDDHHDVRELGQARVAVAEHDAGLRPRMCVVDRPDARDEVDRRNGPLWPHGTERIGGSPDIGAGCTDPAYDSVEHRAAGDTHRADVLRSEEQRGIHRDVVERGRG